MPAEMTLRVIRGGSCHSPSQRRLAAESSPSFSLDTAPLWCHSDAVMTQGRFRSPHSFPAHFVREPVT